MGAIATIQLEHLLPSEEPRLWIPDQVVGAYGDMLCATRDSALLKGPWAELERKTTVMELSI